MTIIRDLPLLAILPLEKLLFHERHDQQRSPLLLDSLRKSGVLRNPPIVAPLHDRTGRYMVLDGAHRTLAFKSLGLKHILAQVVEPDDPSLRLYPWNHILWGFEPHEFTLSIAAVPYIRFEPYQFKQGILELQNKQAILVIRLPDGVDWIVYPPTNDLVTRVNFLNAIVDRYKDLAQMDRTNLRDMGDLMKLYPHVTGLVLFPNFRIEEVMYLAGSGYLLPTGTTRFSISPRALHVNYPLDELFAEINLEEKDKHLQRWLQESLAKKGVRYYSEATFLFDE